MKYENVQIGIALMILLISLGMWYTTKDPHPLTVGLAAVVLIVTAYIYYQAYQEYELKVNVCPRCQPQLMHKTQLYCPHCGKKMK